MKEMTLEAAFKSQRKTGGLLSRNVAFSIASSSISIISIARGELDAQLARHELEWDRYQDATAKLARIAYKMALGFIADMTGNN